jgi:threonine aldolase
LAEGLASLPHIALDLDTVQTNIVFFEIEAPLTGEQLAAGLKSAGVRFNAFGPTTFRFVTHYAISRDDIERVLLAMNEIVA